MIAVVDAAALAVARLLADLRVRPTNQCAAAELKAAVAAVVAAGDLAAVAAAVVADVVAAVVAAVVDA